MQHPLCHCKENTNVNHDCKCHRGIYMHFSTLVLQIHVNGYSFSFITQYSMLFGDFSHLKQWALTTNSMHLPCQCSLASQHAASSGDVCVCTCLSEGLWSKFLLSKWICHYAGAEIRRTRKRGEEMGIGAWHTHSLLHIPSPCPHHHLPPVVAFLHVQ